MKVEDNPMSIQLERRKEQRCVIVVVRGSFEAVEDAKQIRTAISETLAEGQRNILVNLTQVTSLDDFGVESLLACGFMTSYAGGCFLIFGANASVRRTLIEADGRHTFARAQTEASAVEELRQMVADRGGAPFDILEFVREEEQRGDQFGGLGEPVTETGSD